MEPYKGKFPEKPFKGGHYVKQPTPNAARAGQISRMDRDVGRIMDLLVELGIEKDTLVVFTSDNGPCPAGGQDPQFFNSNGPLKGGKRSLYEGGIRVPTIAWWPGTIDPGTESDHPSAFWDMMPTFAEMAGAEAPANDGISILPTLQGRPADQQKHDYLYWAFANHAKQIQAVRFGDWKAIRNKKGEVQLYNLSEDIAEKNDLFGKRPEIVKQAEVYMQAAQKPLG